MARDGAFWRGDDAGDRYDLVVVGGGISGLSAAYFYPQAVGENARILVLDNARGDIPRSQRFHEKANPVNASSSLSPRCSRVGIHPVLKAPTTLPSALLVISCEIGAL